MVAAEAVFVAFGARRFDRTGVVGAVTRRATTVEADGHARGGEQVVDRTHAFLQSVRRDKGLQLCSYLGVGEADFRVFFCHDSYQSGASSGCGSVHSAVDGIGIGVGVGAAEGGQVGGGQVGLVGVLTVHREHGVRASRCRRRGPERRCRSDAASRRGNDRSDPSRSRRFRSCAVPGAFRIVEAFGVRLRLEEDSLRAGCRPTFVDPTVIDDTRQRGRMSDARTPGRRVR